jgi:hypothetical protein
MKERAFSSEPPLPPVREELADPKYPGGRIAHPDDASEFDRAENSLYRSSRKTSVRMAFARKK